MFILHYLRREIYVHFIPLFRISHDNNYNNLKFTACILADFMDLLTMFLISETCRFMIRRDNE